MKYKTILFLTIQFSIILYIAMKEEPQLLKGLKFLLCVRETDGGKQKQIAILTLNLSWP